MPTDASTTHAAPHESSAALSSRGPAPLRVLVLGATSGIAQAVARIWAGQGARMVLVARGEQKLSVVAADLRTRGASSVDCIAYDLDQTEHHGAMLADAVASLGGLDVAFLAYGVLGDQQVAQSDFDAAAAILHTNFVSAVSLLTWLAEYCIRQHSGTLAVLSSVAGDRGRMSNYVYGASKAGLSAYLQGLRNRIDREGATVLDIKPGPVKTGMTASMPKYASFADVDSVAQSIASAVAARKDTAYVPGKWRAIMFVIRHIPERVFKKLSL